MADGSPKLSDHSPRDSPPHVAFERDWNSENPRPSINQLLFQRQLGFGHCPVKTWPPHVGSQTSFERSTCGVHQFVDHLKLMQRLDGEEGHSGCVNTINFSYDGLLLASGSDDQRIILWDWERGVVKVAMETDHVANIFQAKFLPGTNNLHLVSAARDGLVIHHILAPSGQVAYTKKLAKHFDSAHKLALEPDCPHVFLSCGEDGTVFQIDLREATPRKTLLVLRGEDGSKIPLYSIFIDPSNSNQFAVSGMDQFARIFDRRQAKGRNEKTDTVKNFCPDHLRVENTHKANITCLVYSHDGRELLCSYNDDDIYLFDATHSSESQHIKQYKGHRNQQTVKGVNFFGPRSEFVVSGSDCGHVFLWDTQTEEVVQCMEGDFCGVVNCLEPHPFAPVLAVSGLDHDPKIFSPISKDRTLKENVKDIIASNLEGREEDRTRLPATSAMEHYLVQMLLRRYHSHLRNATDGPMADSDEDAEETSDDETSLPLPRRLRLRRRRDDDDDMDSGSEHDDDSDTEGEQGGQGGGGRGFSVSCRQQ